MSDVKAYTFTLFCAALASALFELLAPNEQKRQLSFILGLFILICLLSPITDMINSAGEFRLAAAKNEIQPVDTDELLKNEFSMRVKKIIEQKLDSIGIFDSAIVINITISGQSAQIDSLTITLPPEYGGRCREAEKLLLDELGLAAEIKIDGG